MKKKPLYNEQYCKKHNQHYADFLRNCPICVGEEMVKPKKMEKNPTEDKGV
jgi:hypothetical protein